MIALDKVPEAESIMLEVDGGWRGNRRQWKAWED
jgi:hypothetical protein